VSNMSIFVKADRRTARWSRLHFGLVLAAILFFSAGIRLFQIGGFSGNYDEGAHLMVAWLLSKGFSLYTEVGSNQLPFLYQPTAWLFAVVGASSVLARWLEVGYALLGIVAVAGIGRLLWRPTVGLIAALFLSLESYYFRNSRLFLGSVACVALSGLAILFALYYQKTGHRKWLFLAGVVFSFSIFVKPLSLLTGSLLVWAIIARWRGQASTTTEERKTWLRSLPWRGVFVDCLYLGMAMFVLPILSLILYGGGIGIMLSRLVDCRLAAKVNTSRGSVYMMGILTDYVRNNLALLLLAAMTTIMVVRRRNGSGIWVIAWLGLSLLSIIAWRAHSHHLVILDLPLTLLAAYSLGDLADPGYTERFRSRHWTSLIPILGLAYWLGSLVLAWPSYFSVAPRGLDRQNNSDRWAAVGLLQEVTTPAQFVVSDDLSIPFEARRMVIPQLADVSSDSIGCGLVTQEMVMQLADGNGSAVIFWTNRFLEEFPIMAFWTGLAYTGREQFSQEHIIYYDRQPPQIAHPLNAVFGQVIALEGYESSAESPSQLTFYWRKLSADALDYKFTLRLLNAGGELVAQYDDQPYQGYYPTSTWPVGVLLPEQVALPSVGTVPPGEYALVVGLYDPQTLKLLPVEGPTVGNHNLISLEVLTLGGR
jgi:hypothetical protein